MKLFKTFFAGGYECADMINNRRTRVDLLKATAHDVRVHEDYQLLSSTGISTAREGIRWSVVEHKPYVYDFTEVKNRITAAQSAGIQQLWDICHFGYPDGLTPLDADFSKRFVAVCEAFTRLYRMCTDDPLIITPVNEISFLCFLTKGMGTVPFKRGVSGKVKYELCRATIRGAEAIKAIDPAAKILLAEPLIRIHPAPNKAMNGSIGLYNRSQFEAMDIVTGRMFPELGGSPSHMDVAGFNYYYQNQWEHRGRKICWKTERDRCNVPGLLKKAADRYKKPIVLSETGHFKEDRGLWMEQITEDCINAMEIGVDLQGICIYPVLDRPDWDTLEYIQCGIWGYDEKTHERTTETGYLHSVQNCIAEVNNKLLARNRESLIVNRQ